MDALNFNTDTISPALDRLAAALADPTPVLQEIGEYLVTATKDRFLAGQAPDGTPWAPKSPTTIAAYRRRNEPVDDRPLFGPSGSLYKTIHHEVGSDHLRWGSAQIYAAVQQFGAAKGQFGARMGRTSTEGKRKTAQDYFVTLPWGDIPARPFIGLSADDEVAIVAAIEEYLEAALDA